MADFKVYDWNPYSLPRELLEAIGLVGAAFAQSEEIVQDAIAGCAGLDIEYGLAFTTHLSMPMRIDILRAVAEIRIDDLDALDELDEHLAQFEAAAKKRNDCVHNRWCIDPATGHIFRAKHSARGSVKVELIPTTVEQIRADAKFIYEVGMNLFVFLKLHGFAPDIANRPSRAHKTKAARKRRRES
jgi:hypothetical protein